MRVATGHTGVLTRTLRASGRLLGTLALHDSCTAPNRAACRQWQRRPGPVLCSARRVASTGATASTAALPWHDLLFSSKLAKWSGYCYYPQEQLPKLVEAEGLKLVASGRTPYTSWYVADGQVDYEAFHQTASASFPPARRARHHHGHSHHHHTAHSHKHSHSGHRGAAHSNGHSHGSHHAAGHRNGGQHASHRHHNGNGKAGAHSHHSQPTQHADSAHQTPPRADDMPETQTQRFVFIRGVQWSAHDVSLTTLTTALMNFWPTPLPLPQDTQPQPPLVCHTGVTQLAVDLFKQLAPYLADTPNHLNSNLQPTTASSPSQQTTGQGNGKGGGTANGANSSGSAAVASTGTDGSLTAGAADTVAKEVASPGSRAPGRVCIAGHSLGGALGMLVLAQCALAGLRPGQTLSCHTFGSPPVLAHRDGGGGQRVLRVLGLPDKSVMSFVLEHDPVPRALLTADPAFTVLKSYAPVRQLLDARGWLGVQQQRLEELRQQVEGWGSDVRSLLGRVWGDAPSAGTAAPASARSGTGPEVIVPVFTPNRFVFENVGNVYLMRGGAELVPVAAVSEVEELLRLASVDMVSQPARALQAWLDHHHASYAHDLEIAALAELKRQLRRQLAGLSQPAAAAATAAAAAHQVPTKQSTGPLGQPGQSEPRMQGKDQAVPAKEPAVVADTVAAETQNVPHSR